MRSKPIFETLEPRLLLSADLAPVEGVLEVMGTNESDLAFVTARAERLLVELNGQAYEFALEDIKEIRVDLGEGDNRFEADLLNPVGILNVVAGSGSDLFRAKAQWDGARASHPDFLWLPTFNPGAGDDRVHADWSSVGAFSFGEGPVQVDARIVAGDGNDEIAIDLSQLAVGAVRAPVILLGLDTGLGDNVVRVSNPLASAGGSDPEPPDPAERRAPVSLRHDSRAGTDRFELIGGDAAERYDIRTLDDPGIGRSFELLAGDLASGHPLLGVAASALGQLAVDAGAGDDQLGAVWEHRYEFRPGKIAQTDYDFDTGAGSDVVELVVAPAEDIDALGVDVQAAPTADPDEPGRLKVVFSWDRAEAAFGDALVAGAEKLRLATGGGDDRVTVEDVAIDVDTQGGNDSIWMDLGFPVRDGTSNTLLVAELRGGAGDDFIEAVMQAPGPPDLPAAPTDLFIDAGDGDDTVMFNPTEYTLTKDVNWSTRIDTGDGDDRLVVETSAVRLGAGSRVEWLYDLGAGDDDVTHIRANWEIEEGVQYDWTVDLGEGDDTFRASIDGQTVGATAQVGYGFFGGAGDDHIEVVLANLVLGAGAAFRSQVDTGDGDDVVVHEVTHVVQQGALPPADRKPAEFRVSTGAGHDFIDAVLAAPGPPNLPAVQDVALAIDLGTGADTLHFEGRGSLQDPLADLRFALRVDAGGADAALPEVGDEVLVTFMNGDPDRPFVMGTLWNSQDAPEDDKRLETSLLSAGGGLAITSAITGGAARDEVRLSVDGIVGPKTQVDAEVDLGAGADAMTIDFTGLEAKGPTWRTPIDLDLRGGAGGDTLAVTGTRGNDWILLAPRAMHLAGGAHVDFGGFESVHVDAGDGNDRVWMLGRSSRIDWRVDGGDGRDRFFPFFGGLGDNVTLFDFENPKLKKHKR